MTRPEAAKAFSGAASDGAVAGGTDSDGAAAGTTMGAAAKSRLVVVLPGLTSKAVTIACIGETQAAMAVVSSKATSLTSAEVRNPAGIS